MALIDAESVKSIILIVIIIWVFSGAGIRTLQKLAERLLEDL